MESTGTNNDTRGWIMCTVSGVACVIGASIIYVEYIVRLFPSQRQFRIQDSNVFLACSFSLSFGVMLFSALYSMLPTSMRYLTEGGVDRQAAGFVMMGCFVGGFFGIQIVSRLLHQLIPSHVVDCDHSHEEPVKEEDHIDSHDHTRLRPSRSRWSERGPSLPSVAATAREAETNGKPTEATPLLPAGSYENGLHDRPEPRPRHISTRSEMLPSTTATPLKGSRTRASTQARRPSMFLVRKRVLSFMKDTKANCDEYGPCYGYTDPCGQECFKHVTSRSINKGSLSTLRTNAVSFQPQIVNVPEGTGTESPTSLVSPTFRSSRAHSRDAAHQLPNEDFHAHSHGHEDHEHACGDDCSQMSEDLEAQHHHHVPTNAFLSIGLQTVIAIALHKFPEGFITYATNHANPSLGLSVFMALFVHNIAEGFSMALPLYMAVSSRWKAMVWSSLLGGLSQPLGAAIAVAWFKIAKRSDITIDDVAYACLFAATAGIMTSVALQLFVESLSLSHNRNLSIVFAFLGMMLFGFSNALVEKH